MKNSSKAQLITIPIVMLVVYNLLVFILSDNRDTVFWTSYIFTLVSLIIGIILPLAVSAEKKDKFLGISAVTLWCVYILIQLFLGILIMILATSFIIAFTIEVIVFAFFFISVLAGNIGTNYVESFENNIRSNTSFIRDLTTDIEIIKRNVVDADLSKKIKQLEETVRYSDVVSNEFTFDIENVISAKIEELKSKLISYDKTVLSDIDDVMKLFEERNIKCKAGK